VAFVQADDTGTFTGNTTSLGSGTYHQVLAKNTGIGHTVVLVIQTLTAPGTQTDTVTSVASGMGTFHFVNSYNDGADYEIWVCTSTTGAADTLTVNTPTNAWDAFAVEFNQPATGFVNGGGTVTNPGYLANQSWTVSPGAAGNVALVAADTADAYETGPAAPWTYYNHGYWSFFNGTSAAWQVAQSSAPVTATWETDGGESNIQGVVLQYGGTTTTTTAPSTTTTTVAPTTTTTQPASGGNCTNPVWSSSAAHDTWNNDSTGTWWVNQDAWNGGAGPQSIHVCSASSWYAVSNQPNDGGQVETYPDTEYDVGGRNTASTKPISGFNSITSTFSEAFKSNGKDGWDAGYDLWTNNWANETMIWNQWAGGQSYWVTQANGPGGYALTLGGVPYHFYANGSELMFFRDTQVSSGSVDLLAAFQWEVAHGFAKASDVPTQLEYGVEVCYTGGVNETFPVTGLTFALS